MQHISPKDLYEFEDMLEKERAELEAQLAEHGKKTGGNWQGTAQGFEGAESDETDEADSMEELATNVPLVETLETRLRDVADALDRIKNGSYGTDEGSGEPISVERLRANPAARTAL